MQTLMDSHNVVEKLRVGLPTAVQYVFEGIMEGGSRLKLLLRIIRNYLDSTVPLSCKHTFMTSIQLYVTLPDVVIKLSENTLIDESWYTSCLIDLLELYQIAVKLLDKSLCRKIAGHLVRYLDVLQSCLAYPHDKQQRMKTLYLTSLHSVLEIVNDNDCTIDSYGDVAQRTSDLLSTKQLQKLPPLMPMVYSILYELLRMLQGSPESEDELTQIKQAISSGSGQWLVDSAVKDSHHKRNFESSLKLLLLLLDLPYVLNALVDNQPNLSAMMAAAKDHTSKLLISHVCIRLIDSSEVDISK